MMIMMITQSINRPAITTFLSWLVLKEAFGIVEIGKEMLMLYLKASQILTNACLFLLSFNFCLQYTQRHLLLSSESPAHHFRNRVSCPAAIPVWDWQHTGDDNDNDSDSDDDTHSPAVHPAHDLDSARAAGSQHPRWRHHSHHQAHEKSPLGHSGQQ